MFHYHSFNIQSFNIIPFKNDIYAMIEVCNMFTKILITFWNNNNNNNNIIIIITIYICIIFTIIIVIVNL